MRWPNLLLVVLVGLGGADAGAGLPGTGGTYISGGDLAASVRLTAADEDAFFRRINRPPRLMERPRAAGEAFSVYSGYWNEVVPDEEDEGSVASAALYYPADGFVRAEQAGEAVWLVLDLRQRAIIDRYVRLAREGLIDEAPGVLDVLSAAARTEPITVEIGARRLSATERALFWGAAAADRLPDALSPAEAVGDGEGIWLVFGLTEGRSLRLLFKPEAGRLIEPIGGEVYAVPRDWLRPVLGAEAPGGLAIEQRPGSGSPLWWLVMIGGGLFCLAAALWLRRRRSSHGARA